MFFSTLPTTQREGGGSLFLLGISLHAAPVMISWMRKCCAHLTSILPTGRERHMNASTENTSVEHFVERATDSLRGALPKVKL